MRTSDLVLTDNLMDMRQGELQRAALASRRGLGVRPRLRLLSSLGHHLIALGSWLRQASSGATLEHENTCLEGSVDARPVGR